MGRKRCLSCAQIKPSAEFYKHPGMADGRLNKCMECHKRDIRLNRANKIEYYRQFDRERAMLPHRVKAREEYQKTKQGIASGNAAKKRWAILNSDRKAASVMVNNAVRDGRLTRLPCQVCGSTLRIHGHHEDYSKPLQVKWLCPKHHAELHKLKRL